MSSRSLEQHKLDTLRHYNKKTNKGRVVYDRKKHIFNTKACLRVIKSLTDNAPRDNIEDATNYGRIAHNSARLLLQKFSYFSEHPGRSPLDPGRAKEINKLIESAIGTLMACFRKYPDGIDYLSAKKLMELIGKYAPKGVKEIAKEIVKLAR